MRLGAYPQASVVLHMDAWDLKVIIATALIMVLFGASVLIAILT